MRYRTPILVLTIVALTALACGPCGLISDLTGEEGPEIVLPTIQPELPPAGDEGEQPTPPSPPDSEGGAPEISDLDALDSYRVRQTIRVESQDGSEVQEMSILEEWVREPPAQHVVISGSAMPETEIIHIGDKAWIKSGDTWVEMPSEQAPDFTSGMDITPDVGGITALVGDETVNGVNCKHYTVDEDNFAVADPSEGSFTAHIRGDVWIADQPGLPSIVVRELVQIEGSFIPVPGASSPAEGGTTYFEKDVTDINAPIVIEPPE